MVAVVFGARGYVGMLFQKISGGPELSENYLSRSGMRLTLTQQFCSIRRESRRR